MNLTTKLCSLTLLAVVFSLVSSGCSDKQVNNPERVVNPASGNFINEEVVLTLDDVHGDHNLKMIGGWGGLKTHESWFLRTVWSPQRVNLLIEGLKYFYIQNGAFPSSFDEFSQSSFLAFTTVDPVSFKQINYNHPITSMDDYLNLIVDPSSTEWTITGRQPNFPGGEWIEAVWQIDPVKYSWDRLVTHNNSTYPNAVAMKGAYVANCLFRILWERENRRNSMPVDATDLLDGLWIVNYDWAADNPNFAYQAASFQFGLDSDRHRVVAIWTDLEGSVYSETWVWNPWPEGVWRTLPVTGPEDPDALTGIPMGPVSELYDGIPEVLWTCSLLNSEPVSSTIQQN